MLKLFFNYVKLVAVTSISTILFSCAEKISTTDDSLNSEDTIITYSKHIAAILYNNCVNCHRPGQAGPFNLLTYKDALTAANKIKFVTETRYMPPWPADPEYTHFIGERVLSENEIQLIKKWVEQGKKLGDSPQIPVLPKFYDGSFFGKPDLVIPLQQAIELKGNGADHFLTVKLPYKIPKDTFVSYFEFVPNKRKLLHHVNGHLISYNENRKFDQFAGATVLPDVRSNFKEQFSKMSLNYKDKLQPEFPQLSPNAVYYLPGYTPPVYPAGVGGYTLKKNGAILLANIHYGPSAKDILDSSYVNVFFAKSAPQRPIKELQLGTFGVAPIVPPLVIAPEEIKTFHTQWQTPEDISILSINPHMHLIGKSMIAYALQPNGDTIKLIRIKNWDFRWQYYYTFPKMLKLPAGSVIHVYATYDNTSKNPNNPFHPPHTISEGEGNESMQTSEEMLQFIFSYLPYQSGDENLSLEGKK